MDDAELLRGFEELSLPLEAWTHRAHVRAAYCYLERFGFVGALERMRGAIKAFNAHHRVPDGPTSGYNETTTVAFLRVVEATRGAYGKVMPTADGETFCETHPHLLHRQLLRLYYSPEQRMRPEAKERFVEPDLAALPRAGPG